MKDETFIDTNILVYAFDESEKQKRAIAKKIVSDITTGEMEATVSNQVLAEFFIVVTTKIEKPISAANAKIIVDGIIDSLHWRKINYTSKTVSKAIEASITGKNHFWDALIKETMLENGVYAIMTENTKDFKSEQIKAINPL